MTSLLSSLEAPPEARQLPPAASKVQALAPGDRAALSIRTKIAVSASWLLLLLLRPLRLLLLPLRLLRLRLLFILMNGLLRLRDGYCGCGCVSPWRHVCVFVASCLCLTASLVSA